MSSFTLPPVPVWVRTDASNAARATRDHTLPYTRKAPARAFARPCGDCGTTHGVSMAPGSHMALCGPCYQGALASGCIKGATPPEKRVTVGGFQSDLWDLQDSYLPPVAAPAPLSLAQRNYLHDLRMEIERGIYKGVGDYYGYGSLPMEPQF